MLYSGGNNVGHKKDTKTALLSVLVNRFLLTENEGSTCSYRGPSTNPDMGQAGPIVARLAVSESYVTIALPFIITKIGKILTLGFNYELFL